MVEPYASRYEALSKQPTAPTNQALHLPTEAIEHLRRSHRLLHVTLRRLHEFLTQANEIPDAQQHRAKQIRSSLLAGFSHDLLPRHIPVFMTTETIFDAQHRPYIVSINCHAPRHWDTLARETETGETALTTMQHVIDAIKCRTDDVRPVKIITDSSRRSRFPHLENRIHQAGLDTYSCTMKEAASPQEQIATKQLILDLPLLQGTKGDRKSILKDSSIIIEPFAHLSSQSVLAILTDPEHRDFIEEHLLHGGSLGHLRAYLPDTVPLAHAGIRRIEDSYVVKNALPLSSQRTLGRFGQINPGELRRQRHAGIAQEAIESNRILVPTYGTGPFRCISISYGGNLLAAFGIVRIPANGIPAHDISVKIMAG